MNDGAGMIQEQPATLIEPVRVDERIHTLDVLRGFALFGILFVNVYALANPSEWFTVKWAEIGLLEQLFEGVKLFFVQGKFYTLFAFLFGLGFAVQLERSERRNARFAARFLWRLTLLMLFGLFHLVFLWDGDILNTYAVAGVILLLGFGLKRGVFDRIARRMSKGRRERAPRWLALLFAGILIFGPFIAFAGFINYAMSVRDAALAGEALTESQQDVWEDIGKADDPARKLEREKERAETRSLFVNGSYIDTVSYRIERLADRVISGPFWFTLAGIFLVGAYFGRNNFIGRGAELRSGFRKLAAASLLFAVPLSALFVYVSIGKVGQPQVSWWQFLEIFLKTVSGLAMTLFFVAAITLLMQTRAKRWLQFFAPVGRMALSNYLLQSLIGTTLFYGYGLGLMNHLGSLMQVVYIVLLFAAQVMFSRWWLARYRFGPLEWLWRSGTYMKRQPMKREPTGAETALAHS